MSADIAAAAAEPALPLPRRAVAIAAVLAAMTMVVLDAGVSNLALPTIAATLAIPPNTAILVIIAYQTALIMALLPCGALGARFGHARVFAWGVALFALASGVCALAPSLPVLIAARFAEGLGGAAVLALGVALLRLSVSDERLGAAISWNALTVALATAAGPVIGALLLSHFDWRWIYVVNLPLGALVIAAAQALPRGLKNHAPLDFVSMALNAAMFGLVVLSVETILARPLLAIGLMSAAAAALIALVRRASIATAPLLPIDLLRLGTFRIAVIASVCCFTGQTIALVALPFYLQHNLHQSAAATGLYMTPWPLAVAATAFVVGRLVNRIPAWALCVAGAANLTLGLAMAAFWPLQSDLSPLVISAILCGAGFGLFQTPNNRTMFMAAPAARSGAAGAMQGTARLLGQTSGAVIMTLIFALIAAENAPQIGLAIGAGFTLLAALVSALGRTTA